MNIHFSPSTLGFYVEGVHAEIPQDAIEITADLHATLIAGQADGLQIVVGQGGMPQLQDRVVTEEQVASVARAQRDERLVACDWVVLRATETGKPVPAAWATYRQALRDLPMQKGFPQSATWPVAPKA